MIRTAPDRPLAGCDLAAVVEFQDTGRIARCLGHRLRQCEPDRAVQDEYGLQQAHRGIIGRQDVEQPRLCEVGGGDVARMRAAAHHVGRAHHDRHAAVARGSGGFAGGREFRDRQAEFDRLRDMRRGGVVVTRLRQAARASQRGQRAPVGIGEAPVEIGLLLDVGRHLGIGVAELALVILVVFFDGREFPSIYATWHRSEPHLLPSRYNLPFSTRSRRSASASSSRGMTCP